jgi:hypothetical protein
MYSTDGWLVGWFVIYPDLSLDIEIRRVKGTLRES